MKTNLSNINTVEDLIREQKAVRIRIKSQEKILQQHLQKLPGELVKSGVSAALPAFLTGKATTVGLTAAGKLVNYAFAKVGDKDAGGLFKVARQAGIFTILRLAYKSLVHRKR